MLALGDFSQRFLFLGDAEILVDLHDTLPTDLYQIFKGHYGVALPESLQDPRQSTAV